MDLLISDIIAATQMLKLSQWSDFASMLSKSNKIAFLNTALP